MTRQQLAAERRWQRYKKRAAIDAVADYHAIKTDAFGNRVPWTKAEIQARYNARKRRKEERRVRMAYWREHDPVIK